MKPNPENRNPNLLAQKTIRFAQIFGWVGVFLLAAVACAGGNPGGSPTPEPPTDAPSLAAGPYPLATLSKPTVPAYPAPVAGLSPLSDGDEKAGDEPGLACANPPGASDLLELDYFGAPDDILAYLDQGATLADLDTSLVEAGMGSVPRAVWAADLTGDGLDEIVVSIFDPNSPLAVPSGTLLIFRCVDNHVALAHQQESEPGAGVPHIWYLEDLDGDLSSELVVSEATCGAHTCFEEVWILSWDGQGFENVLQGSAADLPTPDIRLLMSDEPPRLDVEAASSGILSVGAGPQRTQLRRWGLQSDTGLYEIIQDELLPSDFRIHILHDAEQAAKEGDNENALFLYDQAVNEIGLKDWMDPGTERAVIGAYARFRIVQLLLIAGEEASIEDIIAEMEQMYPQSRYLAMTRLLLVEYSKGGFDEACRMVEDFAAEHRQELLAPLGSGVFGYTNPDIEVEDICNLKAVDDSGSELDRRD